MNLRSYSALSLNSPAVEMEPVALSVPWKLVPEELHLYLCPHTFHDPKGAHDYYLALATPSEKTKNMSMSDLWKHSDDERNQINLNRAYKWRRSLSKTSMCCV